MLNKFSIRTALDGNLDHVYKDDPFLSKCASKQMELYTCYEEAAFADKLISVDIYLDAIDKSKVLKKILMTGTAEYQLVPTLKT